MIGIKKTYTSVNQLVADQALSNRLFRETDYERAKSLGTDTEYLMAMANTKDKLSSAFDEDVYNRLSDEDRFNYFIHKNFGDKTSQSYKDTDAYFDNKIEEMKNDEIYQSLTGFEKGIATVGGWIGSLVTGAYGTLEGLIDAVALVGGGVAGIFDNEIWDDTKKFIAQDTTGYTAAQNALTDFRKNYTFERQYQWMGAINDVHNAVGQMVPLLVTGGASGAAKAAGTLAYYGAMYGQTAESAVKANPDINYGVLMSYTTLMTGLEAGTEWLSGKVFGEGLIGVTGFNPKQISGGIFKTLLHNMGTEAAEEAVSELFGGILEYWMVTQDKESLPTLDKVLYAALIGGITGGFLAGGRIAFTPRMSVTSDGQVKYNRDLTADEKKNANKLGLGKSWTLQGLLQQSTDALNSVDKVTQLQTKYSGLSLEQIKTQHAKEYEKAVAKDTETKEHQAKSLLSLAKLMSEIGVENFKEAAALLEKSTENARVMVDNYINHRAEGNKKASEVFAANFPNRSFTPTTIPSKTNQAFAEAIKQAFPNVKVVFGTFGDKNGEPVRAINGVETYIFIDENFVDAKGFEQALTEGVRYQLAEKLMEDLNIIENAVVDKVVKTFLNKDVKYSDLTREQKLTIAQMLCFDDKSTRKLFRCSNKTHQKIYKTFVKQAEDVKKLGRKSKANTIRYHELLVIRNMYIQNIIDTIGNMEDVATIIEEYNITEEEIKESIAGKMRPSNLNDKVRLTKIRQVAEVRQKYDAIHNYLMFELATLSDEFDFNRLYDPDYYLPFFVEARTRNGDDFETGLKKFLRDKYGVEFMDKAKFDFAMNNTLTAEMVDEFAKEFLTKEYLNTNPSFTEKKAAVIDALYTFSQTGSDTDGDSVIVTDTEVKGTGRMMFMNIQLFAEKKTKDSKDVGYHYGDISYGKKTDHRGMMAGRGTGHFGTGFYFVSDPKRLKEGGSEYAKRNQDVVDFSKYKLFKPNTSEDADALHKALKAINDFGYVSEISMTVDEVYDLDYENPKLLDLLKLDGFSEYTLDRVSNFIKNKEYGAAEQELIKEINKVDKLLNDVVNAAQVLSKLFNVESGVVETKITQALDSKSNDSYSTVFMKKMGYNGVDVRHSESHDNWQYGSVIYDIAPETVISSTKPSSTQNVESTKPKKTKPNITEKDIAQLASTDYRSGKKDFSKAKGYEGREYEVASVIDYENKNGELLRRKIKTIEDLKTVLTAIKEGKIGSPESGFVMNLIQSTVLTFNFKGKRHAAAKAMFDEIQGPRQTYQAEEFASRSELFAQTNPMKALSEELSQKHGAEIKPSEKMMIKWVPMYADRTNWLNRIQQEYDQLIDKRKHTQDPYTKEQINEELKYLRTLASAVAEDDTATILDLTIQKLQKSDENKIQNETTIQEMTRDFVADLIQHTDTSGPVKYNPNKKYILKPEHAEKIVDFWKKVNAFRYLAMLSSPATWGRNALTNTLVCVNAIVEDVIGGKIEQSRFLRQESQANFTGDYTADFGKAVEDRYKNKIQQDTAGDKYHSTELEAVRQKWAEANDPMKKSKLLGKIKNIEQKMLNDQPWTKRRVMRNLKNMLAGSMNMISKSAYAELKAMYKGETAEEIYTNMLEKDSPLAEEFKKVYITDQGADMVGVLNLAAKLSSTSVLLDQIYEKALYRGNKLLFKTDNVLSKKIGKLQDKHPMTAALITAIVPFARTSFNTSAYIVNHSPIGLAKGIIQAFQTRNMYYGDMREAITNYHKTEYIKQHKEADKDFKFNEAEFKQWCDKNLSGDVVSAINGDYKSIKSVFNQYVELGRVSQSLVGASDIFARATTIESISQGLTGTGLMVLGILLATMIDGFKIDEDDYLGPVLQVGDLRFKLDDLSPFSTLFSVGAVINSSEGFLDGFEKFAGILIDSSMLNVVESAIQYSDSIPDYLGNQQINFVQQFIPAIFKSFTKVIDNAKKDKSGNFYEKLIKTTASNLPLFSYLVADKIDPYTGEKEKIYQSGLLEAAFNQVLPIGIRSETMSDFEREARRVDAETTGLTGRFKVNDIDYDVKDKQKYSKYRAEYINEQYYLITSGKQKVTVEDDKGKRITTTYDKLTDKQKQNVINRLYTDATSMTKIKWWTDQGNTYVVTDKDLYSEYRKMFSNIVYKKNWSKSKFVES